MVSVAPVPVDVNTNAESVLLKVTWNGGVLNAASMIVAAFEKLLAPERSMLDDVSGDPAKLIVSAPAVIAFNCVSVMPESDPPRSQPDVALPG